MDEFQLTKADIDSIKQRLVELMESGQVPEDLAEHLKDMGVETPEELMTTMLPAGHWQMMADKWLNGGAGEQPEPAAEMSPEEPAEEPAVEEKPKNRLSVPPEFAPKKQKRLPGLQKEGDDCALCKTCAMHKESCTGGPDCALCKMCGMHVKGVEPEAGL